MWAYRSFFSRQHLLLSRLRPVCRHASQPPAIRGNGGNNLTGSRGHASSSSVDSHAEVIKRDDPAAATKRHLYVVLDDHKDGYGIHKLDLDPDKDDGQDGGGQRLLPGPPVLRVAFPDVNEGAQFAALGSTIVATHISAPHWTAKSKSLLCTGHVTSDPEEWKVGTEKLFRLDKDVAAGWNHIDAKLVPLARAVNKQGSGYCLI
ncbi:hypothetical protein ACQ4PT_002538 [Festuca glaucescens]